MLDQAKINENLVEKLSKNDQMFVNINTKLDGLTLSVRDQLAFNTKIELKVAQLAFAAKDVVSPDSVENVNAVTMRGGKTTRDHSYPNHKTGRVLGILNANKKIRKRTDTDVAFTREYSRVSIFHRERECTN